MNKSKIPLPIYDLFRSEMSYKGQVALLGQIGGNSYYHYDFAEPVTIGFPKVVKFHAGIAVELEPSQSLDTFRLFLKD